MSPFILHLNLLLVVCEKQFHKQPYWHMKNMTLACSLRADLTSGQCNRNNCKWIRLCIGSSAVQILDEIEPNHENETDNIHEWVYLWLFTFPLNKSKQIKCFLGIHCVVVVVAAFVPWDFPQYFWALEYEYSLAFHIP